MNRRGRRSRPDPLAPVDDRTWYVVRDLWGAALELEPLAPGIDLRSVLERAREARIAAGWNAPEIGRSSSSFYCEREGQRLLVGIERRDPSQPTIGHSSQSYFPDHK